MYTTMRFWLLWELSPGRAAELQHKGRLPKKLDDEQGWKTINVTADPLDPTAIIPIVDESVLEKVTCRMTVYDNFSKEGMYRRFGATLQVKTEIDWNGIGEAARAHTVQRFNFSAPNLMSLCAIYTEVRKGDLQPEGEFIGKQEKQPHDIVINKLRADEYRAYCLGSSVKEFAHGRTVDEAVGKLVVNNSGAFGLQIRVAQ